MMNRSLLAAACFAVLVPGLTGCSGDYHVYQRASASGFAQGERPPPGDAGGEVTSQPDAPAAGAGGSVMDAPADTAGGQGADAASGYGAAADETGAVTDGAAVGAMPEPPFEAASSAPAVPSDGGGGSSASPETSGAASPRDASLTRLANAGGPVRLEIPSIGVDAPIEHVGLTDEQERAMDAPTGFMNVGWYDKGFQPGEAGNSVIAGHLDTSTGGPAVFWDLDKVNAGDEVLVTYANGDRYTFMVEDWEVYDHNAQGPIIDAIFGKSQSADLNLVTCDGAWDHGAATYSKRLVVFTTLVPEATVWAGGDAAP